MLLWGLSGADPPHGSLDDLRSDAVALLRVCEGVEHVECVVSVSRPTHRIIHIADAHVVAFDDFARDLRDEYGDTITDDGIAAEYASWLTRTRRVQASQRMLLRCLAATQGVQAVYCEGLTDDDLPVYRMTIRALSLQDGIEASDLLHLGAAGQLLVTGTLRDVLPAEDVDAFAAADPFATGTPIFDGSANDAREAAIVQRLISGDPLAIIILGAAHDLSDAVRAVGTCEYLRVFVTGVAE